MPANTPNGWPYVLPTDHPLEFPAASQALATKLESEQNRFPYGSFSSSGTATTVSSTAVVLQSAGSAAVAQGGITFDGAAHSFVVSEDGWYLCVLRAAAQPNGAVSQVSLCLGINAAVQFTLLDFYVPASSTYIGNGSGYLQLTAGQKVCAMAKSSVSRPVSYVTFAVQRAGTDMA